MKRGVITLLTVIGSLALTVGAPALTTENPYNPIVERNVFGLKPPPPPVDPAAEAAAKQPPPNIFLTGITTIFGNKRVMLKTTPSPAAGAKPGAEKPSEESYTMAEGQRDGDIEVLAINEKSGTVKIRLAGKEMTLDFETNGIKTPAAGAVGGGLPGVGGPGMGLPGFTRPSPTPFGGTVTPAATSFSGGVNPTMPSRTMRLPGAANTGVGSSGYASTAGGIQLGGYNVTPGNQTRVQEPPPLAPEEQAIMIEVERERNRNRIRAGTMPPPPITPITPADAFPQPVQNP